MNRRTEKEHEERKVQNGGEERPRAPGETPVCSGMQVLITEWERATVPGLVSQRADDSSYLKYSVKSILQRIIHELGRVFQRPR